MTLEKRRAVSSRTTCRVIPTLQLRGRSIIWTGRAHSLCCLRIWSVSGIRMHRAIIAAAPAVVRQARCVPKAAEERGTAVQHTKPVQAVVVVGMGSRAAIYAQEALRHPDKMQDRRRVADVDPGTCAHSGAETVRALHPQHCFASADALAAVRSLLPMPPSTARWIRSMWRQRSRFYAKGTMCFWKNLLPYQSEHGSGPSACLRA